MATLLQTFGFLTLSAISSHSICSQGAKPAPAKTSTAYFATLRDEYAKAQPGSISWVNDDERKKLIELFDEKAPEKFIDAAPRWLSKCPVDAKVEIMLASLLARIGKYEESIQHRHNYYGLLASIVSSGDGKSAATAFKVIAVDEEYTLLNYMGAERKQQSLQGVYDVMNVVIDGKPRTIFFDVSVHLKALEREFANIK